jgi:hypothetical protein
MDHGSGWLAENGWLAMQFCAWRQSARATSRCRQADLIVVILICRCNELMDPWAEANGSPLSWYSLLGFDGAVRVADHITVDIEPYE